MSAQNGPDEPSKPKRGQPGSGLGRTKGSKNILSGDLKKDIREFFTNHTIGSMKWRENVVMHLEKAPNAQEFYKWSVLAYGYMVGRPGLMTPEAALRSGFAFVSSDGYLPWDARATGAAALNARSQAMIEAKEADLKLQAEAKANEVIEGKDDGETLESVN